MSMPVLRSPYPDAGAPSGPPLTDLVAWYKADALSLSDGALVATWPDSSGAGADLTQATSGSRPIYHTARLNSLPGVTFDGSDDFMGATFTLVLPEFVVIVGRWVVYADYKTMCDGAGSTGNRMRVIALSPGVSTYSAGFGPNPAMSNSTSVHLIEAGFTGSAQTLALDSGSTASGPAAGADGNGITLGARAEGTEAGSVEIFEALVYRAVQTGAALTALRTYLTTKWGL
jgi:hypothetical protein